MKKDNSFGSAFKKGIKDFFTKGILLKIVSLVFAMLLWGYVLMSDDPERTKTIANVPVNIEGEADLIARKLVLRGSKNLGTVSVKVRTPLTEYADLTAEDITATISLASITEKGEYTLTISARSSNGTTAVATPSQVTVEVDNLATRRIPVEVSTAGELPEGYWCGALSTLRSEIDIEGAAEDLAGITKAVGTVDLSACTESVNTSLLLGLVDAEGNEISSDVLQGALPSATVKLEVLPVKTVPIDIESALLGTDSLPNNFEMVSNGINGSRSVRIVGDEETLSGIDALTIEPIDVSGRTESILMDAQLIVPEGVRLLDDDTVSLYVNIREKSASASFVELPIEVEGLGRRLNATMNEQNADIVFTGRVSLISVLERNDIELYVDLNGMTAGRYEVPISIRLPNEEMMVDLSWTLSSETITVTVE